MFRLLYLPLLASLVAAQSLPYRHVALRQQTADSVTVVASWTAQHADSVRIAYGNGITRTRGPRGRDSVRVARPSAPATFGVTLTPLRGSVVGAARVLSVALPVRPQPAPSIDSASIDTVASAPVVVTPPSGSGGGSLPFFSDNFDNGQRNNANGFQWLGNVEPRISNERAYSGSYAMRFQFNASAPGGQAWSEERFDMGRYLPEVAIQYMIWVPSNYKHRAGLNNAPVNNKFLMLWRDVYGGTDGTWAVGIEWWRTHDYQSWGRFMSSEWDKNWMGDHYTTEPAFMGAQAPMKPGQWNRIRFHTKAASARGASDGVLRVWVNDVQMVNFTAGKFHNFATTFADATLRRGYLLGYMNSGFDEQTIFYIDDVKFFAGNPGW